MVEMNAERAGQIVRAYKPMLDRLPLDLKLKLSHAIGRAKQSLEDTPEILQMYHSVPVALAQARVAEFRQRYGITDEALATMLRSGKVIWRHGVLCPGKKFKLKPVGVKNNG